MNADLTQLPAETLLQHGQFVRAVARGLLGDEHLAEDVAQDTWLRWMKRPPRERNSARGWLSTVGQNLAINSARSRGWRRQRERSVARPEKIPDHTEQLAHAEVLEAVVAAVLDLDEPLRSTILLSYFHGWSTRRIAAQTNVPVSTVRSRLRSGLSQLRSRLDPRTAAERESFGRALYSLAGSHFGQAGGALSLSSLSIKLGAAALLVTAGILVSRSVGAVEEVEPVVVQAAATIDSRAETPLTSSVPAPRAVGDERAPAASAPGEAKLLFTGTVTDLAYPRLGLVATPTARLAMDISVGADRPFYRPSHSTAVTLDEAGSFEVEVDDPGIRPLQVRFVTEASGRHRRLIETRRLEEGEVALEDLQLSRAAYGLLIGRVVDAAGEAQVGVPIALLGAQGRMQHSVTSDASGAFEVELHWRVAKAEVELRAHSIVNIQHPLPLQDDDGRELGGWSEMRIVLLPAAALQMHVVDSAGRGMEGVSITVKLHPSEEILLDFPSSYFGGPRRYGKTDADGRLLLEDLWAERKLSVKVSRRGESHTSTRAAEDRLSFDLAERSTPIILGVGETRELQARWGPDYQISGTVRDTTGNLVARATVTVHDQDREYPFQETLVDLTTDAHGRFHGKIRQRSLRGPLLVLARGPSSGDGQSSSGSLKGLGYAGEQPVEHGIDSAGTAELELRKAVDHAFQVDLVLKSTHVIEGTIRTADGQSVRSDSGGSRVWAVPAGSGSHYAHTTVGSSSVSMLDDGSFKFQGLPAGLYDLYVSEEIQSFYSFKSFMHRFADIPSGQRGVELVLPDREVVQVELRVHSEDATRMTVLHGRFYPRHSSSFPKKPAQPTQTVDDAAGWPMDAALHFAGISGGTSPEGRASFGLYATDDVEEHTLPVLGPGWYVFGIHASDEEGRLAAPMATELRYYEAGEYTIDFHPMNVTTVQGRVIAEKPMAIALFDANGGAIPLQAGSGRRSLAFVMETTATGEFRLRDVPIGPHRLRVGPLDELKRGDFTRELLIDLQPNMEALELRP